MNANRRYWINYYFNKIKVRKLTTNSDNEEGISKINTSSLRGQRGASFRKRLITKLPQFESAISNSSENNVSAKDFSNANTYTDVDNLFPSDIEEKKKETKLDINQQKLDPREKCIFLFPGQGSQYVGMGSKLITYPGVKDMFTTANKILGYDLMDLCINGPKDKLDKTIYCQPAVFVTSLAAVNKLKEENPKAIASCVATAGFSVGEYASLVFAGVMSFEEALEIVKVRAEAMQKASQEISSGMMSVFVGAASKLGDACKAARQHCTERWNIEDPVCQVANFLQAECKVIAGNTEALKFIEEHTKEFAIRRVKWLPVSGAFHTRLMQSATEPVFKKLKNLTIQKPSIVVHSNVTSKPYTGEEVIRKLLIEQIYKSVKWEQTMHLMYSRNQGEHFPWTYELGPGKQLGTLLRLINGKAYAQYKSVDV